MENPLELKKQLYSMLKVGDVDVAEDIANSALEEDINDRDIIGILKVIKFWQNRKESFVYNSDSNSGALLYNEWDKFVDFCVDNKLNNKAVFAIKSFVFKLIVQMLVEYYKTSPIKDKETLILMGEAFYEIGMVEKAIETLEYALTEFKQSLDVRIYILLGDIYGEKGDDDLAMIMFNEAFLKFPQLVMLDRIDYPPVRKLEELIKQDGIAENEVVEWIAVYGYLYKGLTTRRGIEYEEYMGLQEKIREYESSLKIDKKVVNIIIPRLVNYYFWIFDYYVYQVNANSGARKVSRRIIELLSMPYAEEATVIKLRNRAQAIFKVLLDEMGWNLNTKIGDE